MIAANKAYHNMIMHQKRSPIKNLTTISEMIRVASTLGFERIEIFINKNDEIKIKNKLRKSGYIVNTTYARTLPQEVFLEITWNTAEFIGETIREIKGDR
jgi:hypothetical protein